MSAIEESRYLYATDTETTGLSFSLGDRIIEIGIVELYDRKVTGRTFHEYVDPGFEIPDEAVAIHGLTREAVVAAGDGQVFADIAQRLVEFIGGHPLVIHNAAFDMGFLDGELKLAGLSVLTGSVKVIDTLKYASVKHPGQRNTLDHLCKRYGIDGSGREFHGALLDAHLLAQVYVPLTVSQEEMGYTSTNARSASKLLKSPHAEDFSNLPVIRASPQEIAAHEALLARVAKESKKDPLWIAPVI